MHYQPNTEVGTKVELCLKAFSHAAKLAEDVKGHLFQLRMTSFQGDRSQAILPRITIANKNLSCNGVDLDLHRKPLTLKLFQIFLSDHSDHWERDQLVKALYSHINWDSSSRRMKTTMRQNTVKLISRSRLLAEQTFNAAGLNWLEWFNYNAEAGTWSLYRIKNRYLVEKERLLGLDPQNFNA